MSSSSSRVAEEAEIRACCWLAVSSCATVNSAGVGLENTHTQTHTVRPHPLKTADDWAMTTNQQLLSVD